MNEVFIQNLNTGLTITFIGMGVVLAFLTLMIFVMNITSKFIVNVLNKYFPEEIKEEKTKVKKKPQQNENEKIALAVALAHHKALGGK